MSAKRTLSFPQKQAQRAARSVVAPATTRTTRAQTRVSSEPLSEEDKALAVKGDPFEGANSEVDYDESESEEEKAPVPSNRLQSRSPSPVGEGGTAPEEGEVSGGDISDDADVQTQQEEVITDASDHEMITNSSDQQEMLNAAIANRCRKTPWSLVYDQTKQWTGRRDPNHRYALYDCNAIHESKICRLKGDDGREDEEFIELFLMYRSFNVKRARVPKLDSMIQAWNAFVDNYTKDPVKWRDALEKHRFNYVSRYEDGLRFEIHHQCVEANVPCALPQEYNCLWCGPTDPRVKSVDDELLRRTIPLRIWDLVDRLLVKLEKEGRVPDRNQTQRRGRHAAKRNVTPKYQRLADSQASVRDSSVHDDLVHYEYSDRSRRQRSIVDRHANRSMEEEEEDRSVALDLSPVYPAGYDPPAGVPANREIQDLRQELTETRELVRSLDGQLKALVADYKCLLGELNAQHISVRRKRQRHADDMA